MIHTSTSAVVLLPLLLLLCACVASAGHTLGLHRHPHRFDPKATFRRVAGRAAGNTIPMNGGVLTLGGYFTEMTIGTGAGQISFNAIVDTGSANLALPSAPCSTCGGGPLYNSSRSPTAAPLSCSADFCQNCVPTAVGNVSIPHGGLTVDCPFLSSRKDLCATSSQCPFALSYGGTSSITMGTVVTDRACLGLAHSTLCGTAFIDQQTAQFPSGTQTTGLVGFAFPAVACNPTCQPTFLDSLVAAGSLKAEENHFGMCLTPSNGGAIDLGYLNTSRYDPKQMRYTNVVKEILYNIVVKDIQVGGVSLGLPLVTYAISNDAIGAFPDSGTSVFLVAPLAMQAITTIITEDYSTVPFAASLFQNSSLSNTACETFGDNASAIISQYPTIQVIVAGSDGKGDITLEVVPSSYLMAVGGGQYCLGIAGVPSIGVILGDVVMENYYIHFDRVGRRVGFAPILQCP